MLSMKKDWLYWRALATPGKTAVVFEGRSVSYAELDRMADGQAAGLTGKGIQPGDKVAARVENSLEAVALVHAVARIDAVFVPLNTRLTAAEIGWQLNLVEPALLVVDEEQVGKGGDNEGQWPGPALDVHTPLPEPMQTVSLAKLGGDKNLIGRGADSERRVPHQQEEGQLQSIVFTSGSTGTPKGVQLSFANHFWIC